MLGGQLIYWYFCTILVLPSLNKALTYLLTYLLSYSQLVMHKICSHFATSSGFVHLVKQYPSSPHETFHIATNAIVIPDEETTGATIGSYVRVANNNLRYNLRLP